MILILFFSTRTGYAQDIQLKDSEKSYALNHPMFLVDADNELPIQQLPFENFEASKFPTLSLGSTTAAVWVKVRVLNQSNQTDWHIQIDSPPVLHSVSVYRKNGNRLIKLFTRDASAPKSTGEVRVNNLLIPLSIPIKTDADLYIKASSNNILRLPIKFIALQKAFEESYLTDLMNGVVFGMLIAFAIYNLFVYLLTKEQPYLYYLGAIFFWNLNLFFYNGFLPDILSELIWVQEPSSPWQVS